MHERLKVHGQIEGLDRQGYHGLALIAPADTFISNIIHRVYDHLGLYLC
jgi:hypothetical protein